MGLTVYSMHINVSHCLLVILNTVSDSPVTSVLRVMTFLESQKLEKAVKNPEMHFIQQMCIDLKTKILDTESKFLLKWKTT